MFNLSIWIFILLIFIFIWTHQPYKNFNIENFQNENKYSFSDELVTDLTSKNNKMTTTKEQRMLNNELTKETTKKNNYDYIHKKINGNDVIRFANLNIKIMSKEDKHKKKLYHYRKFKYFIDKFSISDKKKEKMIKLHKNFINDLDKKNQFFTDSKPIHFYDLINNSVKKLSIQESLESLYLLYCILNQDLLTLEEIYYQFENNFGTHTYFMEKSDYLLSLTGSILVKYPLQKNFIFKTKQMKEIYENIRNIEGIISIFDIYNMRTHIINYDSKLRNYVKNRVDENSLNALKNDKNLAKYNKAMTKIKTSKKVSNYIGNIENNTSNTASGTDQYEEINYDSDDNDVNKEDGGLTIPHAIKRPIKWRTQRAWLETEGPNFIDDKYKVIV